MPNTQTTNHDKPKGRAAKLAKVQADFENADKLPGLVMEPVEFVALLMNCHVATVWSMVDRGVLPKPYKFGRCTRWRMSELRAALAGGK
jgi:hypothetical protein